MMMRRRTAETPHQKLKEMQLELHHLEDQMGDNRLSALLKAQLARRIEILKTQIRHHGHKNTYLQDP